MRRKVILKFNPSKILGLAVAWCEMTKDELFDLMREAGFSTEWTGYSHVQETLSKFERFAQLVEQRVRASELPNLTLAQNPTEIRSRRQKLG